MSSALRSCCTLTLVVLLAACGEPSRRLDEYVFYDGPQFSLKVVRYYRNIPFSYLGEYAVVMCRSDNTGADAGRDTPDAGWRMLGEVDARGSENAAAAALVVSKDYQVLDERTLIAKDNVLNISHDACGHFIGWDPARLPQDMIDTVPGQDPCAPGDVTDCRDTGFGGDRKPRYGQISVSDSGEVGFTVRSPAFRGVELLRVRTGNAGGTWHVETVGAGTEAPGLQPDALRMLPVSLLDKVLPDVSLQEWLESVLPQHSMVIWPDVLVACGRRQGEGQDGSGSCAEIRFNDSEGNSGMIYIAMDSAPESPFSASFHSGVYITKDRSTALRSLAGLRESLAGSQG